MIKLVDRILGFSRTDFSRHGTQPSVTVRFRNSDKQKHLTAKNRGPASNRTSLVKIGLSFPDFFDFPNYFLGSHNKTSPYLLVYTVFDKTSIDIIHKNKILFFNKYVMSMFS